MRFVRAYQQSLGQKGPQARREDRGRRSIGRYPNQNIWNVRTIEHAATRKPPWQSHNATGGKEFRGSGSTPFKSALAVILIEHDLFRKPVPTCRDHALARERRQIADRRRPKLASPNCPSIITVLRHFGGLSSHHFDRYDAELLDLALWLTMRAARFVFTLYFFCASR